VIEVAGREDLEPDVADTIVDLKATYLGDPSPGGGGPAT
jgi:hypothetical protein